MVVTHKYGYERNCTLWSVEGKDFPEIMKEKPSAVSENVMVSLMRQKWNYPLEDSTREIHQIDYMVRCYGIFYMAIMGNNLTRVEKNTDTGISKGNFRFDTFPVSNECTVHMCYTGFLFCGGIA